MDSSDDMNDEEIDSFSDTSNNGVDSNKDDSTVDEPKSKTTKKRKLKESKENSKVVKKSKKDRSDINFKASEIKFNLFNSEVGNLLSEMKVKAKHVNFFEDWLKKFKDFTGSMQEFEDVRLSELVKTRKKSAGKNKFINELISNYECNFKMDCDTWIKCIQPEDCFTSCLYTLNCVVGPELCVDLNVVIPSQCFLSKDYTNNSWIVKCHYYLTYLYTQLIKTDLCSDVTFDCQKEILTVTPRESKKIIVKIHVVPERDTFKLARFEPDKNNIKKSLCSSFGEVDEGLREHPTPYLNSLALQKLTLQTSCEFVVQKLAGRTNILDGIKLLTIWLKNRHLLGTQYVFTEDLLTHIVVHLISTEKITNLMSVYQVLRAFWYYICTSDWLKEPVNLCKVSTEKLALFRENFDIVFLDSSGSYNIATFLLPNVYLKIKSEAELALKWLDTPNMDPFWPLFMIKMAPHLQYDAIIRFDDTEMFENIYASISAEVTFKMMSCFRSLITKHILKFLSKGLTKRILHIVPLFDDDCKENERFETLLFGITLDDTEAFSVIEKGPEGNLPEAADFRKFWGKLSELRRFADSTIKEAVHFSTKTTKERRQIFKKIVDFVAKEKLQIEECRIICDDVEEVLVLKNCIAPFHIGTCEEASSKVINTLMDLDKILRSFTLPLEVTGLQGTSETFSYTNVFPPVPTNYNSGKKLTKLKDDNIILKNKLTSVPKYVEPLDCVIQLNLNSKWPDEIEAIRKIKCAFFLELSKLLKQSNILSNCNMEYINVLYKGLLFRLRLYHPKEISISRKYTKPDGMVAFKDTEESLNLDKNLNIIPKLVSSVYGVHSQYPSYGPSTCLIKRWLRAQLLDDFYIPDIVVDLLNASLYLDNAPYRNAVLPQVAFMRFLKYYGEFDFNVQCVTVNFNNELTNDQINEFESKFRKTRTKFPSIYIITLDDDGNSIFTQNCSKEIVRRFSILCKSAYKTINDEILQKSFNFKDLFVPNMEGYNILIHLKPLLNTKKHQELNFEKSSESVFALSKYEDKVENKIPVVGFDPVQLYLKELRKNYGDFSFFFHDSYGGNVIGGLWKPLSLQEKDFKVSFMNGTHLVDNKLVLNKQAIIADWSFIVGQGLVEAVDFIE